MNENITSFLSLGLKGKNEWWRYLIAIIVIFFFTIIIGSIPIELYIDGGDYTGMTYEEQIQIQDDDNFEAVGLDKNIGLITLISGFIFGVIALMLLYRFLHKKEISSLFNPFKKIRWSYFLVGFAIWGILSLSITAGDMLINTDKYSYTFEWNSFLPLLAICIFLLPFQVAFEELFVRSYIMQGLYNTSKIPAVAIIGSSIIFPALHLLNPEVQAFGWYIMMPYYFGMALLLAIITVWSEGIELAIGVHAANNIILALTVSYEDAVLQTDSIWKRTENEITFIHLLIYFVMFTITLYLCYRFIESRKRKKLLSA